MTPAPSNPSEEAPALPIETLYTPLPRALTLLAQRRREHPSLTVGSHWLPAGMPGHPNGFAFLSRWFATPNLETLRFLHTAQESGLHPVIEEYHSDILVAHNPLKHALGCLRFVDTVPGRPKRLQAIDWAQQGRPLRHLRTLRGHPLASLHQELLRRALAEGERPTVFECSSQYDRLEGCVHAYYRAFLRLCVARGILFEDFLSDPDEASFAQKVVLPAFHAVREETGLTPLIVRLCPANTAHEPHWSWYPAELFPVAQELLETPIAAATAP